MILETFQWQEALIGIDKIAEMTFQFLLSRKATIAGWLYSSLQSVGHTVFVGIMNIVPWSATLQTAQKEHHVLENSSAVSKD